MFGRRPHIELNVDGMECDHCTSAVRRALKGVQGVRRVRVDRSEGRARVTSNGDIDGRALVAAVVEAGYEATVAQR